jgi:zinc protease
MMRTSPRWSGASVALAALVWTILCGWALAQSTPTLPPGVEAGPSVEGISEYRLANGFRVLLIPDASQDTITTNVTYLVGSRHEGYGEAGMAHLLEHLLFKGTPRFPSIKSDFLTRGSRYNGTTSYDRTNYFQTFPASDGNLAWAIDLEADRMVNSFVSKRDLDSEMTVVRNEFESGENSPFAALRERMSQAAYGWHNYGRSVIGNRSDIENVPIERLQAFYRHYYQPDNAIMVIAGRFDATKALAAVAQHFGKIPKPARTLLQTYTREPTQDGEKQVTVRRVGNIQIVSAMYHIPPGTHADYPAMDLLTQILANVPAGRLHKALVESGKAASVFGIERQQREAGSAFFGASVRQDGSLEAAREALLATLEEVAKQPIRDEEIERARTALLGEVEKVTANSRSLAITLSEFLALGDWRFLFWYRDAISKVKREDVQRMALTYFKPQNRTLGMFMPTAKPDRAEIPRGPDLAALLKDYQGRTAVAAGEAFDATPANIEQRLIRHTLPSGLKLALLPKKTRGETVVANLSLRWGDEQSKANRASACAIAGAMLMRGTAKRSRADLRDEFTKLRSTVNVTLEGATIDTIRPSLAATLTLVAEILRTPAFPQAEFDQLRESSRTSLDAQRSEPGALASLHIARHLNPYPSQHWLYTPTLDERAERLQSLTLDEVRRCHRELVGASNAELAVVGDFDPDEVKTLVTKLFGDWKSPSPYVRVPSRFHGVSPASRTIQTPDKANAVYRAGLNLKLRDDDADFPALILGNYLLGASSTSRLWQRIREKEGLSYSVGSWLTAGAEDAAGEFGVSAIYAPQNRARLEAYVIEEIQGALRDGFTTQELDAAKKGLLQARLLARNQDSTLAARLTNYLYLGRTFTWDMDFEKRIQALTSEEVQAALRRHIKPEGLSIVFAGDFARVAAEAQKTSETR